MKGGKGGGGAGELCADEGGREVLDGSGRVEEEVGPRIGTAGAGGGCGVCRELRLHCSAPGVSGSYSVCMYRLATAWLEPTLIKCQYRPAVS